MKRTAMRPKKPAFRTGGMSVPLVTASALSIAIIGIFVVANAASKPLPKKAPVVKAPPARKLTGIAKDLNALKIKPPSFDLSASPIPKLKISGLNLILPKLPGKGILKNFSVDKNVGYQGGAVDVKIPTIDFSAYGPPSGSIPTSPTVPVPTTPTVPTTPSAPTVDCSPFDAAPSCSYVGAPGSSGYETCKQCYPNK